MASSSLQETFQEQPIRGTPQFISGTPQFSNFQGAALQIIQAKLSRI